MSLLVGMHPRGLATIRAHVEWWTHGSVARKIVLLRLPIVGWHATMLGMGVMLLLWTMMLLPLLPLPALSMKRYRVLLLLLLHLEVILLILHLLSIVLLGLDSVLLMRMLMLVGQQRALALRVGSRTRSGRKPVKRLSLEILALLLVCGWNIGGLSRTKHLMLGPIIAVSSRWCLHAWVRRAVVLVPILCPSVH